MEWGHSRESFRTSPRAKAVNLVASGAVLSTQRMYFTEYFPEVGGK